MAEYKIHNRMTHWQKTYPAWISFAAIAFLLAVWEIICSTGLISSLFLPAPSAILTALGKLITSGEISRSLTASLYRILLGFALGSIILCADGPNRNTDRQCPLSDPKNRFTAAFYSLAWNR
mgnify:CR=1 FL=1